MTKKYSMRHMLCIALFLLYCACGCFAAVVQQLPHKGQSALQTYTVSITNPTTVDDKTSEEWQPIRIAVYTKIVEDVTIYCEKRQLPVFENFEENPDEEEMFEGEFEDICGGDVEDSKKMTTQRKNTLLNEVLPEAIKLHTDRLKVKRVKESLKITPENVNGNGYCGDFIIPKEHKTQGIPNADFMIYVSLSSQIENVVVCSEDKDKRPTSALIKFVPKEINNKRMYIRLTAHEIAHGLGFQNKFMKGLKMTDSHRSVLRPKQGGSGGEEFYMVQFDKTFEMLKDHYGCSGELKGLYLVKEGYLSVPPHWERRIAKDELMSTYKDGMGVTGMYYTNLTLAAFHEMPYYSANFSMAEPMSWGKQFGCKLLEDTAKESAHTKYPNMFCKEDENVVLQCTSDRIALGVCLTKSNRDKISNEYRYFDEEGSQSEPEDLMDGYPIIKPLKYTSCVDGDQSMMPGSIVSSVSRCLNLETPVEVNGGHKGNKVTVQGICAKVECEGDKVRLQYKVKEGENKWLECKDGNKVKVDGSELTGGTIVCPNYTEVCTGLPKTEPLTINFYNGTKLRDTYEVVVSGAKKEEKEQDKEKKEVKKEEETKQKTENQRLDQTAVNSLAAATPHGQEHQSAPGTRIETLPAPKTEKNVVFDLPSSGGAGSNGDHSSGSSSLSAVNEIGSESGHNSRNQQKGGQQSHTQATDDGVRNVPTTQNLHSQSLPNAASPTATGVAPSYPEKKNLNETLKNPNQDSNHPVQKPADLGSSTAGITSTPSQSTVSPAQDVGKEDAKVKPSEVSQPNVSPTKSSEDRLSNAKQVESSSELESQTAEQKETSSEGNKADVHSSNSSTTASQGSTKDVPTVETAQPRKNETTNNTSSSTDVHERNNASTAAKEPISEEKNKGSTANQVEDLAKQLVTIGEKNADSSITTSYIGGCLMALLVCVLLVL